MHGQPKRMASYQGLLKRDGTTPQKATLVTEQVYHYYEPGTPIPVSKGFGGVEEMLPGKEVDITLSHRAIKDHLDDVNVEYDLSFTFLFITIIAWPTLVPSITHSESEFYSHSTSKVVRYPAILKKVVRFQDGKYHTEENIAFDHATGKPIATKSYDEFEGTYISYGHPAGWEYPAMRQKAPYENKSFTTSALAYSEEGGKGVISFGNGADCSIVENLMAGDLLELGTSQGSSYFHIDYIDYAYNKAYLLPSQVNTQKPSGQVSKLTILRTGRTNQLTAQVASTTFHDTYKGYEMPIVDFSQRWQAHDLGAALSDALKGKTGRNYLTLAGPYVDVNISALVSIDHLPCETDPTNASIQNLRVEYDQKGESLDVHVISFDILCTSTGEWKPIK